MLCLLLAGLPGVGPWGARAADPPAAAAAAGTFERTPEELSDLRNWISTVRNPNVDGGMQARVFDAGRLLAKDWPEAVQAVLQLLDNSDRSEACIPMCRAITQQARAHPEFKGPLFKLLQDPSEGARREAALALAQDAGLAAELAELAADPAAAQAVRSAALHALGHLADNYVAMQHLIALLEARDDAIEQSLFDALQRASAADGPRTPQEWQAWWQDRQNLSREQWLERTVHRLRKQTEQMQDAMVDLTQRLAQASEQRYRLTPDGERPRLVQEFLNDPLESVQLLAIDLIQQDIAEGRLPGDELRAGLRNALGNPSPRVRRGALTVLGHLRDPQDAATIMSLLADEASSNVRQAAIEALAKISSPQAIPVLLDEVSTADRALAGRIAAVRALGTLCKRDGVEPEWKQRVVNTLLEQHQATQQIPEFSEALLAAMAAIADPALAPVLVRHLGSDKASVRRECVAGLADIGSRRHLTSILPFLEDADSGVRLKAAQAIGRLGESDELLNILVARLNPGLEPDAQVREAVWESLRSIWSQQELAVRVAWALRLGEHPHRQLELLKQLEELQGELQPAQNLEVFSALAERSDEVGLHANAVGYWEQVLSLLKDHDPARRQQAQGRRFRALLDADLPQRAVPYAAELMREDPVSSWPALRRHLLEHLERLAAGGRHAEIVQIGTEVRAVLDPHLDAEFISRLTRLMNSGPEAGPAPADQKRDE